MVTTSGEKQPDPNADRDAKAILLLSLLYRVHFCEAAGIPKEARHQRDLLPGFVAWLDSELSDWSAEAVEAACVEAGVERDTWEFVRTVAASNVGVVAIRPSWYAIVSSQRPKPPQIEVVSIIHLVTFADGIVSIMQAPATPAPGTEIDEVTAATVVAKYGDVLIDAFAGQGLAGLHESAAGCGLKLSGPGEDPFDVLMGSIGRLISAVSPEYRRPLEIYQRMIFQIFRAHRLPQVQLATTVARTEQAKAQDERPRGGWDQG